MRDKTDGGIISVTAGVPLAGLSVPRAVPICSVALSPLDVAMLPVEAESAA